MKSIIYNDFRILIGQNKDENDQIIKQSQQYDIWFHLSNLPSCHVVLFTQNKKIDKKTLRYCAELVKENTKYKNLQKLKVEYIPMKFIKRTHEKGRVLLVKKPDFIII